MILEVKWRVMTRCHSESTDDNIEVIASAEIQPDYVVNLAQATVTILRGQDTNSGPKFPLVEMK